jgi:hypothetical protein
VAEAKSARATITRPTTPESPANRTFFMPQVMEMKGMDRVVGYRNFTSKSVKIFKEESTIISNKEELSGIETEGRSTI